MTYFFIGFAIVVFHDLFFYEELKQFYSAEPSWAWPFASVLGILVWPVMVAVVFGRYFKGRFLE